MPKPTQRTRTSTPKLSEIARHVVAPKGAVSTGWPAVRAKCAELGIRFRPWQPGVGKLILAKRADGKYAATIGGTGMSIPRQVGKTFLVAAIVFALCLLNKNLTVIWTAHRLRTSEETFKKLQAFAKRKRIAPHILKVTLGSGEESIEFRNGSRILFGARERGFGRGFDEVDVLIFDEAQILSENALDDMVPATNQSRQSSSALLLFMGTPPKPDNPSEVFERMRREALSGEDEDTGWVEFGADPGYTPTASPAALTDADWRQVAKANPSYPDDTPREAILRMRKKLGPESFLREGLGIWDEDASKGPFSPGVWTGTESTEQPPAPDCLALAMDVDRVWLSLAAGVREPRSIGAVEPVGIEGCEGRVRYDVQGALLIDECARIALELGIPVAVDAKGPAESLIERLEELGVTVLRASLDDFIQACADVYDAFEAKEMSHFGQPEMTRAQRNAGWRKVGDRRAWSRKGGEISMFEAGTLADWGARLSPNYDVLESVY